MSDETRPASVSCSDCWQDFVNEAALLEHIRVQHQTAYALPPYTIESGRDPRLLIAA